MSTVEGYTVANGTAGNSMTLGGRRKKLKLVTRKQARKLLKKLGRKMRGGAPTDAVAVPAEMAAPTPMKAGARTRRRSRSRSRSASVFGL
jgi:hypothetical protein